MNRSILLVLVCLCFSCTLTNVYAMTTEKRSVSLKGRWVPVKRSMSQDIPIEAFVEDGQLTIQSSTMRSDITIRISDSEGNVVYETIVVAEDTGYVCIDLSDLKHHSYRLDLINQVGGFLYGLMSL